MDMSSSDPGTRPSSPPTSSVRSSHDVRRHRIPAAVGSQADHPRLGAQVGDDPGQLGEEPVDLGLGACPGAARPGRCRARAPPSPPARATAAASTRCTTSRTRPRSPRRSSACSSASPSTYRQEKVTRWGSRSTGSPTTSTSGTSAATCARIRSTSARSRAASAAASAAAARRRAAAATTAGRFDHPGGTPGLPLVGRVRRLPPGALADHQQPDAGRPAPLVRAGGQHRPARPAAAPGRPTAPRRRRAAPRLGAGLGRRGDRLHRAHLVAGADQRGQRHPGRGHRRRPGVQVEPAEPVHRHRHGRAAAPPRAARRRAAPPSARSPSAPGSPPARRRPARPPSTAACAAAVPLAVKESSSGRTPSISRGGLAGGVEQLAGPAGLARRAWPGRPSRRRGRPAAPAARPGAAARRWPRRGRAGDGARRWLDGIGLTRTVSGPMSKIPRRPDTPPPGRSSCDGRVICDRR